MAKKVVVFGIGRLARAVYFYLARDSQYEVVAFTVDKEYIEAEKVEGRPVVPFETVESAFPPHDYNMIIAAGYRLLNQQRVEKYHAAKEKGYRLISYVSSKTACQGNVAFGDNCIIFENNVIQPFARIGSGVIIWCGVHVASGAHIGDHCYVGSHAVINGGVTVGDRSFIGASATIRDGASIGPGCIIGAGACVLGNTDASGVYGQSAERHPLDNNPYAELMGFPQKDS